MKKILPVILILLGIAEIVMAFMSVLPAAIVMGVVFMVLGVKTLLDVSRRKQ